MYGTAPDLEPDGNELFSRFKNTIASCPNNPYDASVSSLSSVISPENSKINSSLLPDFNFIVLSPESR